MTDLQKDLPVILHVQKESTRQLLKDILDSMDIESVMESTEVESCQSCLKDKSGAILVLDWQGLETIKILDDSRESRSFDPRPIYLLVEGAQEGLLNIISDYDINAIHAGAPAREVLEKHLTMILDAKSPVNAFSNGYLKLMKAKDDGDSDKVLKSLRMLSDKVPHNYKVKLDLASTLIDNEDWKAAEQVIDQVLLREKKLPRALHLKSRCLMQRKEPVEASSILRRCTLLNPYNAGRLTDFGEVLLRMHDPEEAKKQFGAARKVSGSFGRATVGLSSSEFLLGNHNEALELMKDLDTERERAAVFNNSGILSVGMKKFVLAHKLYDIGLTMIKTEKLKARLFFNKSLAYFKDEDNLNGVEYCKQAVAADPSFERAKGLLERFTDDFESLEVGDSESMFEEDDEDMDLSDLDEEF